MANENTIQATGTFITQKGLNLITKLAAAKGELAFSRGAVGTGKSPEGYAPESMVNLVAYRMDALLSDYGFQDDKAYITLQVSSEQVENGFLLTEVGIFAQDPDEGEILYAYMDVSTDPTYIYANGTTNRTKFAEFTLYVLIGSVERVTAAITPGSVITRVTHTAENLKVVDTQGLLGAVGGNTTGQDLLNAIAHKVATELVTNDALLAKLAGYVMKSKIVNDFLATDPETVLSGPMGKALKEDVTKLYSDLAGKINSGNLVFGTLGSFSVPANSSVRKVIDFPEYGDNYRLFSTIRGSEWAIIAATYCNNNQAVLDIRNFSTSSAINISVDYTVIRK